MLFFFTFSKKVYALGIFYLVWQIIDDEEVWSNSCFCLFSTMIPGSQTSTYLLLKFSTPISESWIRPPCVGRCCHRWCSFTRCWLCTPFLGRVLALAKRGWSMEKKYTGYMFTMVITFFTFFITSKVFLEKFLGFQPAKINVWSI